jgi:hypothetical protein
MMVWMLLVVGGYLAFEITDEALMLLTMELFPEFSLLIALDDKIDSLLKVESQVKRKHFLFNILEKKNDSITRA